MAVRKSSYPSKISPGFDLTQQGAKALLAATIDFLRQNDIPRKFIVDFATTYPSSSRPRRSFREYKELERAQEGMGIIMGTWFSNPRFLDGSGYPLPLSATSGTHSVASLVRASGALVRPVVALDFMRQSPSIKIDSDGRLNALKRVFVLPKWEVFRAAFVVERYLETVLQIASARKKDAPQLLERSCHVSEVDLSKIIPLLRDLGNRGTAFLDSIDGDLEVRRLRHSKRKTVGELGIHVFVWTRPTSRGLRAAKEGKRVRGEEPDKN